MTEEFDWSAPDVIAVKRQDAIAVYTNPNNDIVIREQRWPDDDIWIVISRRNVRSVIEAIERAFRESSESIADSQQP